MKTSIVAVLFLSSLHISLSAQEPRGASLEGIVVDAGTGKPLERATATLTMLVQTGSRRIPQANTDHDGRFAFQSLEPGLYSLQVNSNGYVSQNYDLPIVGGPTTGIRLAAGQSVKGIVIALVHFGTISGTIRNADGEPQKGVVVQVLSATFDSNGQTTLQAEATARTDDRGEYRLFYIAPGRYYVSVSSAPNRPLNLNGAPPSPNGIPDQSFPLTYFPGVLDVKAATSAEVLSGADTNVDFVAPPQ